ncbi:TIGR02391 family protein [Streptomyces sp. NPDC093111]|uniref:TIGR02391 family protein n=1 Tax=Streptomyces sp. NPDC093111 TaxID=3154978 RepID=UPI0034243DEE
MQHDWAIGRLRQFVSDINSLFAWDDTHQLMDPWGERRRIEHLTGEAPDEDALVRAEVVAKRIAEAYQEGLWPTSYRIDSIRGRWEPAKESALRALALAESAEELDAFLRPSAPVLGSEYLHPWVWESARPLWVAGARQEAVLSAARTVNARLQQKVGRHDVSEADLVMQCFDLKDPQSGKPRLRVPGDDRTQPSWVSAQEGAKFFGVGCFRAIRNLAAHLEDTSWTEQQALEYLASFSAFARWVDSATVELAS